MAITLATGESLNGDGNELAHIDLLIGSKSGPVGAAFASAFTNEKEGHTNLLAVVTPNLPAKPDTVISNKVTIKGEKQAVQLFGPGQAAVARAVGASPLAGLRTVVPGAGSGIGRAIAVAFAAAGARVGIGFWQSSDAARALAAELGGSEHPLLQADLGTLDGCEAIVAEAFGALEH